MEKYQEKHNITDRDSTYPFSIWGEFKINSLKQYVKKYDCKLLCKESFETCNFNTSSPYDDCIAVKNEEEVIDVIWKKYSTK